MNNFLRRSITGLLFVILVMGCTLWGSWTFLLLLIIINSLGIMEYYKLWELKGYKPQKLVGLIAGSYLVLAWHLAFESGLGMKILLPAIPLTFLVFIVTLYRDEPNAFIHIAATLSGIIYISIPMVFMQVISRVIEGHYSFEIVLGIFLFLWANDTFAYLAGSNFGRRPLFKRISPKKSWEGFFGGVAGSLLIAWIYAGYFPRLPIIEWLMIALIVSVSAVMGDLAESLFKRNIGVKDSGKMLPGHGGILDRFDGLLLAAPFVTTYLLFIYR